MLTLVFGVVDFVLGSAQITEKRHIFTVVTQVFVFPFPLIAGDQDIHLSIFGVVDVDKGRSRGHRHTNQDQEGHNGPSDLNACALMKIRRFIPFRFAVVNNGIEHHPKDHHTNNDTNPKNCGMKIVNCLSSTRHTW